VKLRASESLSRARRPRAVAGVALCALMSFAPPHAVTEKDFEDALGVVERTIAASKWKEAKALLLAALEKHKEQPWVLYHMTEIEDALERCAFLAATPRTNPKDLISGDLLSYSASSGQIDLRYVEPKSAHDAKGKPGTKPVTGEPHATQKPKKGLFGDFIEVDGAYIHPLSFDGPFTVIVRGSAYPALNEGTHQPSIVVCAEWNQLYLVAFGLPERHVGNQIEYLPAKLIRVKDNETETLEESTCMAKPGAPYELKVVVQSTNVTVYVNDQKLFSADKPSSLFGRFAFRGCPAVSEVLMTGKIQPAWIQGVVDTDAQVKRTAFDRTYHAVDELPAWLQQRLKAGESDAAGAPTGSFFDHDAVASPHYKKIEELLAKGKEQDVLDYLHGIQAGETTEGVRHWLELVAYVGLGRPTDALETCRKILATSSRDIVARLSEATLVSQLQCPHQAVEICRNIVADFPDRAEPVSLLAEQLMLDDRADEARATVHAALDAGIPYCGLERINSFLVRALKGPAWTRKFEYKSEHYDVESDINAQLCFDAATLLEKFYKKYDAHLHRAPTGSRRLFRVCLFSCEASYLDYVRGLPCAVPANSLGEFDFYVKQLLIWNYADVDGLLRTVRHEGFHQYLDRLIPESPRWLNEGSAKYFEVSKLVHGNWVDGEMQPELLAVLRKSPMIPLTALLHLEPRQFYEQKSVGLHYAESWAFIHFLLNTGAEHKKRYDKLLDAMFAGATWREATSQVFDSASMPALQREFDDYVVSLK
jgi:hypothetical protein